MKACEGTARSPCATAHVADPVSSTERSRCHPALPGIGAARRWANVERIATGLERGGEIALSAEHVAHFIEGNAEIPLVGTTSGGFEGSAGRAFALCEIADRAGQPADLDPGPEVLRLVIGGLPIGRQGARQIVERQNGAELAGFPGRGRTTVGSICFQGMADPPGEERLGGGRASGLEALEARLREGRRLRLLTGLRQGSDAASVRSAAAPASLAARWGSTPLAAATAVVSCTRVSLASASIGPSRRKAMSGVGRPARRAHRRTAM